MRKFNILVISYMFISWIVSFSSSLAMEIITDKENRSPNANMVNSKEKPFPSMPYLYFSSSKKPFHEEVQKAYSTVIRLQLCETIELSKASRKLNSNEVNKCLVSFRYCLSLCEDWEHPIKLLFQNMIKLMKHKYASPVKRQEAAHKLLDEFLQTLDTTEQIDACEMKLMFLLKDSEFNPNNFVTNSAEIFELRDKLKAAERDGVVNCYLQFIDLDKLFGIEGLYFNEKDVQIVDLTKTSDLKVPI